ncbi:MAG: NnrU family protein [Pseudomonadota bacterium]|nr:NnrU family protein [Pseudomonadota bacterium]
MLLLILGVLLWALSHLFKRIAPDARANLGDKGRGLVALASFAGIALMVIGYKMADGAVLWGRHPATVGINNLLMLFAVYLFAVSGMKTWLASKIRHPMLTGVKVWTLAHLLVNGDVPSFVLFGGLLVWAVLEVILINRQAKPAKATGPFPVGKEIGAVVGALIVYAVIAGVHTWLGYPTFG